MDFMWVGLRGVERGERWSGGQVTHRARAASHPAG